MQFLTAGKLKLVNKSLLKANLVVQEIIISFVVALIDKFCK